MKTGYGDHWNDLNKSGNLQDLCKEISDELNIPFEEVVKTFPRYIKLLTNLQCLILARYYMAQYTKLQLHNDLGKSVSEIDKILDSAVKALKKKYTKEMEEKNE